MTKCVEHGTDSLLTRELMTSAATWVYLGHQGPEQRAMPIRMIANITLIYATLLT